MYRSSFFFSSFLFLIKIEEKEDANFLNSNCNNLPNDRNNRNNLNSYEQSFLFFLQSVCTLWAIVASINALDIDNIYAFKYILVYVYYIRNSSYRFGARRNLSILLPQDVILYTPASSWAQQAWWISILITLDSRSFPRDLLRINYNKGDTFIRK